MPPRLLTPQNEQDFEALCRDLWERLSGGRPTELHGRSGQGQQGVDLYPLPGAEEGWLGVQCKNKGQGQELTEKEIEAEVEKALDFEPPLTRLLLATSAPRDAKAQKVARRITEEHRGRGLFEVGLAFWEDISRDLLAHQDLLRRYFPDVVIELEGDEVASLRRDYARKLWGELQPLPLYAMGTGESHESVPLSAVYTSLDVEARIGAAAEAGARGPFDLEALAGSLRADRAYLGALQEREVRRAKEEPRPPSAEPAGRRLRAIEAVAAAPRLVLTGAPGGGKSTFARHLALCHVGEVLGRGQACLTLLEEAEARDAGRPETWPHGRLLPLVVELRRWVWSESFPPAGETAAAHHLEQYLKARARSWGLEGFEKLLRLDAGEKGSGLLLVLDGLDETPEGEAARGRIRQAIASWVETYPRSRVLVTSRPYAYDRESPWRLDGEGFGEASLGALDDAQVQTFARAWYAHLTERKQVEEAVARARAESLWREIGAAGLRALADRPLMLTILTDLHAKSGGTLPSGGRASVYEQSVKLLLDRWNQARGVLPRPAEEKASGIAPEGAAEGARERTAADALGMRLERLREALEELAFEVHCDQPGEGGEEGTDIPVEDLWRKLQAFRPAPEVQRVDEAEVRNYLSQRSGVLVEEGTDIYRFPHRSYQEYLAACHLKSDPDFPALLMEQVEARPELWREVVSFVGGQLAKTASSLWLLLADLLPEPTAETPAPADPAWLRILHAALAVEDSGVWRRERMLGNRRLGELRGWLERSLAASGLGAADRAACGRVLARLGDERPGVGAPAGRPQILWCEVEAGKFLYGSTDGPADHYKYGWELRQTTEHLSAFEISLYPVTNAQYGSFVAAGGYREASYWSEEALRWLKEEEIEGPQDFGERFGLPSQPRVGVSLWEAEAFCRWLSEVLGEAIRLPTEEEWEKAARGSDGRTWPWGDIWEEGRSNSESVVGEPSVVGAFPGDESPCGALDMAGNVWEWTGSLYEKGPYRVIRGGSWANLRQFCRAAYRNGDRPAGRDGDLGFRLVRT